HFGACKWDTELFQRQFKTKVAHQGADNSCTTTFMEVFVSRDDIKQIIAVDRNTSVIDKNHPVAVAVKCYAEISTQRSDFFLQSSDIGRAAFFINVDAVWRVANGGNARTQFFEYFRRDFIGSAVSAVDHNGQ